MDIYPQQPRPRMGYTTLRFLSACIVCAVFAFFTQCVLPLSLMFSSLAILFAVLSKGKSLKLHSFAVTGVSLAVISMIFSVSITAYSIFMIWTDPMQREAFNQSYEQLYGITFDQALDEFSEELKQQYQPTTDYFK